MNRFDSERESRKGWSWDYTLFTIAISIAVLLQPWLLPWLGWRTIHYFGLAIQVFGIVVIIASLGVHIWARQHLRQFYVERVEVQKKHWVIQTGPYSLVRHPIITTFFGLAIGLLLLNPSIVMVAVAVYTFSDFSRAASQEEKLLIESLPGYANYMAQTPRFIPKLGRKI